MHKNSPLKWLISLSLALILLLHPRMSYGAQILVKSYEMPQQSASRVITFTLQCNSWESGAAMMKRFAVLTQAVVERMKRLPPSSLNEMDLSICMRCQPTETGTRIVPCSTSSNDAEHMESQAWLLKQTLEMAS